MDSLYDVIFSIKSKGSRRPFESMNDQLLGKTIWDTRDDEAYGYSVDPNTGSSANAVTYLGKAKGFTFAGLRNNTEFEYGSWKNSWIIKGLKPCVLSASGEVLLYLDPNDYSKDVNGNDAPITQDALDNHVDPRYHGANVMVEFPKIWVKCVNGSEDGAYSVYFSDHRIDEDYKDYAYIAPDGSHKEHFYKSVYVGSLYDGKVRSVSNAQVCNMIRPAEARSYSEANGSGWHMDTWSETILIAQILTLLGENVNSQARFGWCLVDGGTQELVEEHRTGVCNHSGMFMGDNRVPSEGYSNYIKVLGIENYYGLVCRYMDGLNMSIDDYSFLVKMCYGTEDGSTENGYSDDSTGYVNTHFEPVTNTVQSTGTGASLRLMKVYAGGILLPSYRVRGSASTTYYSAGNSSYSSYGGAYPEGFTPFATRGGSGSFTNGSGSYTLAFNNDVNDNTNYKNGVSISYV